MTKLKLSLSSSRSKTTQMPPSAVGELTPNRKSIFRLRRGKSKPDNVKEQEETTHQVKQSDLISKVRPVIINRSYGEEIWEYDPGQGRVVLKSTVPSRVNGSALFENSVLRTSSLSTNATESTCGDISQSSSVNLESPRRCWTDQNSDFSQTGVEILPYKYCSSDGCDSDEQSVPNLKEAGKIGLKPGAALDNMKVLKETTRKQRILESLGSNDVSTHGNTFESQFTNDDTFSTKSDYTDILPVGKFPYISSTTTKKWGQKIICALPLPMCGAYDKSGILSEIKEDNDSEVLVEDEEEDNKDDSSFSESEGLSCDSADSDYSF
mmetsp:Transcript_4838/g.9964  ORF Transcript_4838/g.9964 Transcript_4838/m.9964 type:complete len:323 (-) Transcript_4838:183-1151(-)